MANILDVIGIIIGIMVFIVLMIAIFRAGGILDSFRELFLSPVIS